MGGQTIRLLAQLLENGDPNELSFTTDGSINSLLLAANHGCPVLHLLLLRMMEARKHI